MKNPNESAEALVPNLRSRFTLTAMLLLLAACEPPVTDEARVVPEAGPSAVDSAAAPDQPLRPGIHFAPDSIRVGDLVGVLVLDSISASPTVVDSTYVGTARFAGEIAITGSTFLHPDADLRTTSICFEADDASAGRLPRWKGDERRPWFCFENPAGARELLGPPRQGVDAHLVVERFTIHRGLSDEVNSARLVRVVSGAK